ncbi:MAG: ThiF family adenylyltransferase [Chitinophagales bacterium]
MLNEFSRTELLIGKEALEKLRRTKVAVFGIGGVGTFVVEGLARAGVGRLVLIDHDVVCLTNLNRQIHATHKTIGLPKVEVMKERILDINPQAEVETHQTFYTPDGGDDLIRTDYDYIVDAIDNVAGKIDLAVRATEKGIPIISSMGAGNKLDPSQFRIADIYETSVCPLARVMRRELRKRGITSLKVVYSTEPPVKPLDSEEHIEDEVEPDSCAARKQTPGSISFVPSVAGLLIAGEVIRDIIY